MTNQDVKALMRSLDFESRESYDRAKKEAEFIRKAEETMDLSDGKTALRLYNRIVKEKLFSTVLGYEFLFRLRETIAQTGVADPEKLSSIPVREIIKTENDTLEGPSLETEKYRNLYEGQRVINKKFKIALLVCALVLIAFVVVNFRLEYSIFTYFTNYKATMEEELVNKYEAWEKELQKKENQLESGEEDKEEVPSTFGTETE